MCFCFLSRLLVSSHEGWYQSRMGRNKRIHKNATELCDHIMASGHLRQNNDKVEKDGITTYLDVTNDCIASWRLLWQLLIFILFGQSSIPSSIDVYWCQSHYSNASISHYDCLHPSICCHSRRRKLDQDLVLITSICCQEPFHPHHLHELSLLELIPQLSINLTMLLLSFITKYPVVQSGLQSIFQDKKGETSNPSFWIVQLGPSRVC